MKHTITINSGEFAEAIKTACVYASKDNDPHNGLCYVLVSLLPKHKKVAIIACDGRGYYERRIGLLMEKGQKPSLPDKEQRLCIYVNDIAMLTKFVGSKSHEKITLEVDDTAEKDNQYIVNLVFSNGSSTTIFATNDVNIPDYSKFCKKAENSKKSKPVLSNLLIPIHELVRAGKAFPAKIGSIAKIFTCNSEMALLECQNDMGDIRVIFTFARDTATEV